MKTLLFLRHAKSSWDSPASSDFERPLADRGKRDAPRVGKALRESGIKLDLLVSSTATRARQTSELFAQAAKYSGPIKHADKIYEAGVSDLFSVIQELPDAAGTAMLVGHNPGFEDTIGTLCGTNSTPARLRVPTCTLACVELPVLHWRAVEPGAGTLLWLLVPRIV